MQSKKAIDPRNKFLAVAEKIGYTAVHRDYFE
jgi:hypothetical protein